MKQLQDIDFRAAYGPVPDGFSRSVQQALHQTKEEPMKKFTLRTAVMAVVTVLDRRCLRCQRGHQPNCRSHAHYAISACRQRGGHVVHAPD